CCWWDNWWYYWRSPAYTFTTVINGSQEPTPSQGTGSGLLLLDPATSTLSYSIDYANLTTNGAGGFTQAHIHGPAASNITAGVLFTLNGGVIGSRSGRLSGTTTALTPTQVRSEEHTSELQSLRHLVCRLLLE